MKSNLAFIILLIIGIVFICGCSQQSSERKTEPVMNSNHSSITAITTTSHLATNNVAAMKDPFVGTWEYRGYLTSGPIKKKYTFLNNGTWMRTNTNLESFIEAYSYGTWKKESDGKYMLRSSITGNSANFEYIADNDELHDPSRKETFHRVNDENLLQNQVPAMNIVVYSVQKSLKIKGTTLPSGRIFLLVNLSIENSNEIGNFSYTNTSLRAIYDDGLGGSSAPPNVKVQFDNALIPKIIEPGETIQGTVVFSIPENVEYSLKLVNNEGHTVSNVVQLNDIQTISS